MADPIKIVLTADASAAAYAVREMVQQADQAVRGKLIAAYKDAEKQINKVADQQKILNATIAENGKAIDQLKSKRDGANKDELAALDQQIKKYGDIQKAHEKELSTLEMKRTKLEGIKAAADSTSEAERLGIQLTTQDRMIGLRTMVDQQRAYDAIKAASTSQYDAASSQLDSLNVKQTKTALIVSDHQQRVEKLAAQQKTANLEEQAAIQLQIDALQKVIAKHNSEISVIEEKRVAIEGEMEISQANTAEHITAIEAEVAARQAAIAATREQAAADHFVTDAIMEEEEAMHRLNTAQREVNETSEKGSSAVGKFMGAFAAGFIVVQVVEQIAEALATGSRDAEAMVESLQKLRDIGGNAMGGMRGLFSAYGVEDRGSQKALATSVLDIMDITHESQETAAGTMEALRPAFGQSGISPTSERGKGIASVATRYVAEGADKTALGYRIRDMLQQNPQLTPDQLNQELANEKASAGGSYPQLNAMLGGYQEQKNTLNQLGLGFGDYEHLISNLSSQLSPEAYAKVVQSGLHGEIHAEGLSQDQVIEHMMGLANLSSVQKSMISAMPNQQMKFNALKGMMPKGMGPVVPYFEGAMTSGSLLGPGLQGAVGQLSQQDRTRFLADVVGVRNIAGAAAMNFGGDLQTGASLPLQQPNFDLSQRSETDRANLRTALQTQSSSQAGMTGELQTRSNLTQTLSANPSLWPTGADPQDWAPVKGLTGLAFHGDPAKRTTDAYVMVQHIAELAQLFQDNKSGKIKLTPQQIQTAGALMSRLSSAVEDAGWGGGVLGGVDGKDAHLRALELGGQGAADELKRISANGQIDQTLLMGDLKDSIPFSTIDPSIESNTAGGETSEFLSRIKAQQMQQQGPPAPKGKTPISQVFHQRIYNYGLPSNDWGAPQSWEGNLS